MKSTHKHICFFLIILFSFNSRSISQDSIRQLSDKKGGTRLQLETVFSDSIIVIGTTISAGGEIIELSPELFGENNDEKIGKGLEKVEIRVEEILVGGMDVLSDARFHNVDAKPVVMTVFRQHIFVKDNGKVSKFDVTLDLPLRTKHVFVLKLVPVLESYLIVEKAQMEDLDKIRDLVRKRIRKSEELNAFFQENTAESE